MNSLPFISHHLFIAAIGNDGRGHERPARRERPYSASEDRMSTFVSEVPDVARPMSESATTVPTTRSLRALT